MIIIIIIIIIIIKAFIVLYEKGEKKDQLEQHKPLPQAINYKGT